MRKFLLSTLATAFSCGSLYAEKVDLIQLGKETFHSLGCAECHAVDADSDAIKTGPNLYGLLQMGGGGRKREVADPEGHRTELKANLKYYMRSLRAPNAELAIRETDPQKGEAYPPIMPAFDKQVLSDFRAQAIFNYLRTLNPDGLAGPAMMIAENRDKKETYTPEGDRGETLVTERTQVFHVRLEGHSARTLAVGFPDGANYSFDPRTMGVEKVWWGGFLNRGQEMNGRAMSLSKFGYQAQVMEGKGSLFRPLHPATGGKIDLSFKSPVARDFETMSKFLNSSQEFADLVAEADVDYRGYRAGKAPTFYYQIGQNELEVTFTVAADGKARLAIAGKLASPQTFVFAPEAGVEGDRWTIESLPAELAISLPTPEKVWRPKATRIAGKTQPATRKSIDFVKLPSGYQAESIAPPRDAYGRDQLFEPMGMDFLDDGSLIITTRTAGVWKLSGGTWQQVAEGLLDAMGVVVEKGDGSQIVVGQKSELTRLTDLDGDGVYDCYETLFDDFAHSANYHEYLHGPVRGDDGNYYIQLNLGHYQNDLDFHGSGEAMGSYGGLRGWSLQVTPEGVMTRFAKGLRSPAGLAKAPDGRLFYTDNQGSFMGSSKLFELTGGGFYGYPAALVDAPGMTPQSPEIAWEKVVPTREKAAAILPHSYLANSPGSPVWDTTGGEFGPFAGEMFIGDQTLSRLFRVLPKDNHEAAVISFANDFPSGVMRLAFANTGELYVGQTGRGWRARGGNEDALVVLSRTEEPVANQLADITREGNDFLLHFREPIAELPQKLVIHSWFYKDTPKYGSPEHGKRSETPVGNLQLSDDGKTIRVPLGDPIDTIEQIVYRFSSPELPANEYGRMMGFYTRTGK